MLQEDKPVIFVTGGSRGIGAAIIQLFKELGWHTVACANHEPPTQADLNLQCNVADRTQVQSTIEKINAHFGRLDAVVNNAGIGGSNSLDDKHDDVWHDIINVNLHGTYYVSKHALPLLPNGSGRIVNIASVLGVTGYADQTAYCSAKHAVIGFTKALASHLASRKITVNAICPGWVNTEMAQKRMKELQLSKDDVKACVPLGGFIEPAEIASMVHYLVASPGASHVTGHAWVVDSGLMASL